MDVTKTGIFYLGATRVVLKNFPGEFKSSFVKRLERHFLYILGGCTVALGGFTLAMSLVPFKETASEKEILRIQERYAQLVLNQPRKQVKEAVKEATQPVAEEKVEQVAEETKEEEKVDRRKETTEDRQKRKEQRREDRRHKREMVTQQVKTTGIFAAITATGSGAGGVSGVSDLLSAAGGVGDLGDIDVSKGSFATKGAGAKQLATRRGKRTSGVGIQKSAVGKSTGARIASAGKVNITTRPPEMKSKSGSAVTSKACIQKVINRESRRIKRVYENWLKKDPSLSGQLKVRFVIMPAGNVSNVSVVKSSTGNTKFDENILRYIRRWAFSGCSIGESIEIVFPFAFSGST